MAGNVQHIKKLLQLVIPSIHLNRKDTEFALAVENLVAVDFPGTNAADEREELSNMWKAFERLPDVCVVMVNFNGDVNNDCGELPRLVCDKLCDKVK
ncbi:hypothetical protein R1flu_005105 [Riccia fluitans]|uniref:Uncharacterized protein n=1 Tax=Riccia fluitans TaxID=41844 RepID=A0ABD1YS75_9MARC